MKGFDVLKVKSAVKTHNKFDLSKSHLTTMDFGEIVPLYVEETVPADKFNISADYFSRMSPLVKPTYGRFDFRTVAAFVPYYMVAEDTDAFMAGKTTWEGKTPVLRHFTVYTMFDYLCRNTGNSSAGTSTNYDVTYIDGSGNRAYRVFTNKGKYILKIMNALGYALPQNVDIRTSSNWMADVGARKLSALPLLAFAKLYNDYMSQSQRYNSSPLSSFLQDVKYNKSITSTYNTTGAITATGLGIIFNNIFLNYDNDYFTSAWQTANNAINSIETIGSTGNAILVPADGTYNSKVYAGVDDNKLQVDIDTPSNPRYTIFGQRALDFLKSFDDWVRRNNYSGSRAVQQIYSRFGIKTDDYRSHYAQVISTDKMPVQVGDITSNASTDFTENGSTKTSVVGDYAGKGIMNGSKNVSISVSDYGIILILGYFTVVPMNPYGFDRRVLRTEPLDFYNPEFDGIGADAISVGEYYANPRSTSTSAPLDDAVFGFTERYNAYRYGRDVITGEFRDYGKSPEMNVWHTGRDMTALRDAGSLVAQSTSVNTLPQTDSEYNRIFSVTSGNFNHFYLTARFNVDAVRPMLNLNQVPRLGEGDTVVPRNGNVIS